MPPRGSPLSRRALAQPLLKHTREPRRESAGVRRALAVEHPRFVEQQMRRVLLHGALVVAERAERDHKLMTRIDFQDRLRSASQSPGAGKQLLQRPVGTGL